ncbi:hypothetical protein ADIS_0501 [Lunatimonas lonarensis]|uniref:PKD domain-containing protein n=1 Tax=Lunatimonas lonarensis TaxID=1232681 RepID=R7ZY14_9BACT|nr:hypothetical protein [Lunatimonas lonarensis]EON78908.1 hypothetical protein ADIS_0501 [Lunatimonas lonarensis]
MQSGFSFSLLSLVLWIGAVVSIHAGWNYYTANHSLLGQLEDQDPELIGPTTACLTSSVVFGTFFGAGDPSVDRYVWTITDAAGEELYYQTGGSDAQEIEFPFTSAGTYTVSLQVIRNGNQNFFRASQQVVVERGPRFVMPPDIVFCGNDPVQITAIDPNDPTIGNFSFEWYRVAGQVLGTENTFTATQPGRHYVRVISAACEVVASTFVGPAIEVEVRASANRVCEGQHVTYTPDTPVLARWAYQRQGSNELRSLGSSFALDLHTSELDGVGQYTVFFYVDDPDRPGCALERRINLEVVAGAGEFTLAKLQDADGCELPTGAFEIRTQDGFDAITVSDGAGNFANLAAGSVRTVNGLVPGIYTVTGRSGTCTVSRTIRIENENPNEAIPFTVEAIDQSCSETGVRVGALRIDFGGVSQSGSYRVVRSNGAVVAGTFDNETEVAVNVPPGSYEVEIRDAANCAQPGSVMYEVEGNRQVNFSVPASLQVCESFELFPSSTEELTYTVVRPDGSSVAGSSGVGFVVDQTGTYQFTAISTDPNLCPRTREVEVVVNEPVRFEPVFQQIDCSGRQMYTTELFGRDPNSVIIRWYSENGTIVGRNPQFFPPLTGNYLLEVQPRASSACEVSPIPFEVVVPLRSTEVEIQGSPFCNEDAFTTLTLDVGNPEAVRAIEWFQRNEEGEWVWLLEFNDQQSIDVVDEGEYQVVVRNQIGCRLGTATLEVGRTEVEPLGLEDSYEICSEEGIFPTLQAAGYAEVVWFLDGQPISDQPSYRVMSPGNYEVRVVSEEGCEMVSAFEVLEGCALMIRMPDAMVVGDPQRDFRIYAHPDIDEVEVFIYQRTGELIFHATSRVGSGTEPVCSWDGQMNGRPITVGTYPVVVRYRSGRLGLDEVMRRFLVVVQ